MRAVVALVLVSSLWGCRRKSEPAKAEPAPSVVVAPKASASASAAASSEPPKTCMLDTKFGDSHDDFSLTSEIVTHDTVGGPELVLSRDGKRLSLKLHEEKTAFRPDTITVAREGQRWMGLLQGKSFDICSGPCQMDWDKTLCICDWAGSRDTPGIHQEHAPPSEPSLRVAVEVDGALSVKEFVARNDQQIGDPREAVLTLVGTGGVLAYRATGATFAIALQNDGSPAPDVKPTLVDGGDLTAPAIATATIDGAERAWIAWSKRPKAKAPRLLYAATFDATTGKATLPKPLTRESAFLGTVSAPGLVKEPNGFAIAWFESESDEATAHFFFGRGAKPADAAAHAVEIASYEGEGKSVILARVDGELGVSWATSKRTGVARIRCPAGM